MEQETVTGKHSGARRTSRFQTDRPGNCIDGGESFIGWGKACKGERQLFLTREEMFSRKAEPGWCHRRVGVER
ncbi:hypothetical protein GCM10022407_30230 [Hymenobacter antarcticus]|uniref:Uncharacterized protein n=1 Tax=Hymenobacter antarcticus TaxID=486270 RepID=A0ABP7QI68_9BACT